MWLHRRVFFAFVFSGLLGCSGDDAAGPAPLPPYEEPPELLTFPYYQTKWLTIKEGETLRIETPEEPWSLRFFAHKGSGCAPVVCNLAERVTASVELNFGVYHSYGQVPMGRSSEKANYIVDFSAVTVTQPTMTGRFRMRTLHPMLNGTLGESYTLATTSPVSYPDADLRVRLRGVDLRSFCPCSSTCAVATRYAPMLDLEYAFKRYSWTPADAKPPVPFDIQLTEKKVDACNVETLGFDSRFTLTVKKR